MVTAEDTRTALKILTRAMNIEAEGNKFYLKAAETTADKNGQEMFRRLAGDEQGHYNLMKQEYDSLKQEKGWAASPQVQPVSIDLGKPLFPKGINSLKKRITDKSSDWDALLFGLDIEIRSYDLYRNAAAETADRRGKQALEFLAEQEMGHFNTLMMRYDSLFGPISWYD